MQTRQSETAQEAVPGLEDGQGMVPRCGSWASEPQDSISLHSLGCSVISLSLWYFLDHFKLAF